MLATTFTGQRPKKRSTTTSRQITREEKEMLVTFRCSESLPRPLDLARAARSDRETDRSGPTRPH